MKTHALIDLMKRTYFEWDKDNGQKLAAALTYYTVISLAPLLVITIAIAGLVLNSNAARGQVLSGLGDLLGDEGAKGLQTMITNTSSHTGKEGNILATVVAMAILFFGASGVFGELHDSLNFIWKLDKKRATGIKAIVKERFLSFTMVLGVGFLLTISLIVSAAIAAFTTYLGGIFENLGAVWEVINFLISFLATTGLFSILFKVMPDNSLAWKDVLGAGLITAFLFTIGKTVVGIYLGKSGLASSYGAAGSIILVLIWLYYTAQIFFFGAEFSKVYTQLYGSQKNNET